MEWFIHCSCWKIKGILWNGKNTPLEPFLSAKYKKNINIAGRIKSNMWQGKNRIEFFIEDISTI